jgi:hypothetical protein
VDYILDRADVSGYLASHRGSHVALQPFYQLQTKYDNTELLGEQLNDGPNALRRASTSVFPTIFFLEGAARWISYEYRDLGVAASTTAHVGTFLPDGRARVTRSGRGGSAF